MGHEFQIYFEKHKIEMVAQNLKSKSGYGLKRMHGNLKVTVYEVIITIVQT
jgi:hypothetical protein